MNISVSTILQLMRKSGGTRAIILLAVWSAAARAQGEPLCREGKQLTGDIGIGGFQCVAAGCAVNGRYNGRYRHQFSAEPYVWDIDPAGPSAEKLHEGDRIVAIDGKLVTTPEGGDRLANLREGVPVTLRIRRASQVIETRIVPVVGCNMPYIVVTSSFRRVKAPLF